MITKIKIHQKNLIPRPAEPDNEGARFVQVDGASDHKSMSYGLGGVHGHAYAWIVWKKAGGEDNMGVIAEEAIEAWLDYSIS